MFDINTVVDRAFTEIGWQNTLDTCEYELSPSVTQSLSGVFYNDTHSLLDLGKLRFIGPNQDVWKYNEYDAATTYSTGDKVVLIDNTKRIYYTSLINNNTGNAPASSPTEWERIYPFSNWIERTTKEAIRKGFNQVLLNKTNNQKTKSLLASAYTFKNKGNERSIVNQGAFVGHTICIGDSENVTVTIDSIGTHFTQNQTNLTIYVYRSGQVDPIQTVDITQTGTAGSYQAITLPEKIVLKYSDDTGVGGYFDIGYYEEDLNGNAINNNSHDYIRGCGRCNPQAYREWQKYSKWIQIKSLKVTNSALEPTRTFYGDENRQTGFRNSYGLNYSLNIYCDVTNYMLKNMALFQNSLITWVQKEFINRYITADRDNDKTFKLVGPAQLALNEDFGGESGENLKKQWDEEVERISQELSDLGSLCVPKEDFKGNRIRVTSA
jgi:hypothetical protein